MEDKTRGHCFEALRHTSKKHTQFFQEFCVSEAILEVPREIFSTFCGLFRPLNNAMQARFWSVFKVGKQVYIMF